jgi:S-adenosylmethionine:tRNA ribosyltransferase-isomerase
LHHTKDPYKSFCIISKSLKKEGYKIYAVGTTVLRTLETVIKTNIFKGTTDLYIKPGFQYELVDYLITNFHAPNSSLLSIVLSIYGEGWKELYMYAQSKNLKFLSFGDAVLFKIT